VPRSLAPQVRAIVANGMRQVQQLRSGPSVHGAKCLGTGCCSACCSLLVGPLRVSSSGGWSANLATTLESQNQITMRPFDIDAPVLRQAFD